MVRGSRLSHFFARGFTSALAQPGLTWETRNPTHAGSREPFAH
jgi:hypothetical protein